MAKYFQNFPTVAYKFGDNEAPVLFNNLSAYVDIVDQIKDNVAFYNKYTIQAGDRPDTLSYKLYDTVDYYWTFFLMNDHLRISGCLYLTMISLTLLNPSIHIVWLQQIQISQQTFQ